MLRLNWEGSDWPKAVTPLSKLEVLYGHSRVEQTDPDNKSGNDYGFYFRINEKPFDGTYDTSDEAKQAAEDKYFELCTSELVTHKLRCC